jgi:hypothetical protein
LRRDNVAAMAGVARSGEVDSGFVRRQENRAIPAERDLLLGVWRGVRSLTPLVASQCPFERRLAMSACSDNSGVGSAEPSGISGQAFRRYRMMAEHTVDVVLRVRLDGVIEWCWVSHPSISWGDPTSR